MNETLSLYKECVQCPRKCGTDRTASFGFCGESSALRIASAGLHFGEEPLVTVFGGSGTIFFTGCTLRCSFCHNYPISAQGLGSEVDEKTFVKMCLLLEKEGAENINLVTGSHHIPLIAEYIKAAKADGLSIPVAWNSSGYESVKSLELLKGAADIFLPDLKTFDSKKSGVLFGSRDYPEAAKEAVLWMVSNAPMKVQTVKKGSEEKEKMFSGVIVRHLFMPGNFEDTVNVLSWLKENVSEKACISLMSQYTPVPFKGSEAEVSERNKKLSSIENRLVSKEEDSDLRDLIEAFDFDYLFYQDLSDDVSWLPDFTRTQPFSNKLAKPLWHYKTGFVT